MIGVWALGVLVPLGARFPAVSSSALLGRGWVELRLLDPSFFSLLNQVGPIEVGISFARSVFLVVGETYTDTEKPRGSVWGGDHSGPIH